MSRAVPEEESLPCTAPYEEMMKDVRCPEGLKRRICGVWMKRKKANPSPRMKSNVSSYSVLREVLTSLEGSNGENILCDTLYRYLVLLYAPTGDKPAIYQPCMPCDHVFNSVEIEESEVWRLIREMCLEETRGREAEACRQQYLHDSSNWNLSCGQHPIAMR